MTYDFNSDFTLEDAIGILRDHNVTGRPVVALTGGQLYERPLMIDFLNAVEDTLKENVLLKGKLHKLFEKYAKAEELLSHAVADIEDLLLPNTNSCRPCRMYDKESGECKCKCEESCKDICGWSREAEVLALIEEESNAPAGPKYQTRNLTDEESHIYTNMVEAEATELSNDVLFKEIKEVER